MDNSMVIVGEGAYKKEKWKNTIKILKNIFMKVMN